MRKREDIIAVGLFTAPEFERWGSKLRYVYRVDDNDGFEDLLEAIDKADAEKHPARKTDQPG